MRRNKYGVRGLKGVSLRRGLAYFWVPPISLQKAGVFKHKTLGTDLEAAVFKARDWNARLEAYRTGISGVRPSLTAIHPGTVGHLVRQFEASPLYAPVIHAELDGVIHGCTEASRSKPLVAINCSVQ